ncbi:MAG: 3-phosphoshikimate 1-carboxyvinyltransferase [Desulfobacterales bacterium]|nr:3-phosphoshikimate 1-carboxyvinyltransferase [Desulfobacterales bacterium]
MIEIIPRKIVRGDVTVPGSKSYTHRILIAAALSDGICRIENALQSEDTLLTQNALVQLGTVIRQDRERIVVHGTSGRLRPSDQPVYLGNSGTSMRLLTAVATLGRGRYILTGTERMQQRPIQDLIDGLRQLGDFVRTTRDNGCPPVEIEGGRLTGGILSMDCSRSSQYLSALLLIAPYAPEGMDITVTRGPVSRPYVDMTVEVMQRFGVRVVREDYRHFRIAGGQQFRAGDYQVEPDGSQAGYFWAAAAVTGSEVKVRGVTKRSHQGDVRFVDILEAMGCRVFPESDGIKVVGGDLCALEVDMADMPDLVPTLAVVAAFARGTTVIKNVAHLKDKESDRLSAVAGELSKIGIEARCTDSDLVIKGGAPHGGRIDPHADHRLAMSFAVAGLKVPGIIIQDEKCVEKSFPEFWKVFNNM